MVGRGDTVGSCFCNRDFGSYPHRYNRLLRGLDSVSCGFSMGKGKKGIVVVVISSFMPLVT